MAKGTKASNLISRFPITDLSHAVSLQGENRRVFLTNFVDTFTTMSYAPTRAAAELIYGVQKPLFETPQPTWSEIDRYVQKAAHPGIRDQNIDASKHLFDLVRSYNYVATECEQQVLRVRLKQIVAIGLKFYITQGDRLIFQFPLVRKSYLQDSAINVLGSIIYHAYAQGDFESAEIEVADIGCIKPKQPRFPRIRAVPSTKILSIAELTEQIDEVYDVLRNLAVR